MKYVVLCLMLLLLAVGLLTSGPDRRGAAPEITLDGRDTDEAHRRGVVSSASLEVQADSLGLEPLGGAPTDAPVFQASPDGVQISIRRAVP